MMDLIDEAIDFEEDAEGLGEDEEPEPPPLDQNDNDFFLFSSFADELNDHLGNLVDGHKHKIRLFPVEKILGRRVERGKIKYLVGWKGYPSSQNTWEPKSILSDNKEVAELMENFDNINPASSGRRKKQKRKGKRHQKQPSTISKFKDAVVAFSPEFVDEFSGKLDLNVCFQ